MTAYQRRLIDDRLDELQPLLRAISIHGPKGVGKTATAARRAKTVISLDQGLDRDRLAADPEMIRTMTGPVLIDEWQRWPESWDRVRRAVDDGAPYGQFILAGSSAPRGATVHSGAGRIVPFRMRPLSLAERGIETPTISLKDLLTGSAEVAGTTRVRLPDYVTEIVASGLPGIRAEDARVRPALLDAYIDNIVQREFPEQGYHVRKPETLRGWLAAYAAATSSTASYSTILAAATPGESDKPARTTTMTYRDALSGLWLLDPIEPWSPKTNHFERLATTPKHQLADPALAARLLGASADALLHQDAGRFLGALFEHLVALSVRVYAEAAEARVYHLRTSDARHEIDLIVERPDGKVFAIETKLATHAAGNDLKHISWLRDSIGDRFLGAAVITTGPDAYLRKDDRIAIIPAALLGP